MLPDSSPQATAWLNAKADQFKATAGIEVVTTFVPYKQINIEIEFELSNNLTYMHDGAQTACQCCLLLVAVVLCRLGQGERQGRQGVGGRQGRGAVR